MRILIIAISLLLIPLLASAESIALVSDLHFGRGGKRASIKGQYVYPKKAEKLFKKTLKKLKKTDTKTLIVLGDSTDSNDLKSFNKLLKATQSLDTIWIKGNHDGEYGVFGDKVIDYKDYQIITLDSSTRFGTTIGYLSQEQKNFVLSNLAKPTIVAMHHPLHACASSTVKASFADFKQELENKGNVIAVLSGHCHRPNYQESNGIKYITVDALANKGSYEILSFGP